MLLVLVYHSAVLGLHGGYVGVDVFFVISGFLITNHLLHRLSSTGRVRFADFYGRRIRRILPASFVVIAATIVAIVLFVPRGVGYGALWDAVWSALYVPNVAFAVKGTDYLAETAPSPFQHFWSLGVEEQFYLVWPAVLLALWLIARRSRRLLATLVLVLVLASFAGGVWLTFASQPWAFFSLPSRAWELGVGGLVAVAGSAAIARVPRRVRAAAGWAGLLMIVLAAGTYDATTPFPGVAAALPVLGAALVIACGQHQTGLGPEVILSTRPGQYFGEISYSLYLVHWPILIIPTLVSGAPLPLWLSVMLVVVCIPAAWLLNVFVERPFRSRRFAQAAPGTSIIAALVVSGLIVAVAGGGMRLLDARPTSAERPSDAIPISQPPVFTDFVPSNMSPSLDAASASVPEIYADGCHVDVPVDTPQDCIYGDRQADRAIALFGDSHAAQWFTAVDSFAKAQGFRLYVFTKSSCPSVDYPLSVHGVPYTQCDSWRDAVISRLNAISPDLIVISNMADQPDQPGGPIDPRRWAEGLRSVIEALQSPVVVISDTPNMGSTPAICLSVHLESADECAVDRADAINTRWAEAEAAAARQGGAVVVALNDYICDSKKCGAIIGTTLVYRDAHHLTVEFVDRLEPELADALRVALRAAGPTSGS